MTVPAPPGNCPAPQMGYLGFSFLERVTGIEPALSAWEADVLPLNYTRTHEHDSLAPAAGRACAVFAQTSYRNR